MMSSKKKRKALKNLRQRDCNLFLLSFVLNNPYK